MINSFRSVTRAAVFGVVGAANIVNAASADEQSGARTFGPLAGVSLSVGQNAWSDTSTPSLANAHSRLW